MGFPFTSAAFILAQVQRRRVKLKAKFESASSYFGFKRFSRRICSAHTSFVNLSVRGLMRYGNVMVISANPNRLWVKPGAVDPE
jgi:hypothetical protein